MTGDPAPEWPIAVTSVVEAFTSEYQQFPAKFVLMVDDDDAPQWRDAESNDTGHRFTKLHRVIHDAGREGTAQVELTLIAWALEETTCSLGHDHRNPETCPKASLKQVISAHRTDLT